MNQPFEERRDGVEISLDRRYDILREQIRHEDGLINQRLNWLLLSQGFLFAAFTAIISPNNPSIISPVGSLNILGPEIMRWIMFGIPVTGLLLNYFSYFGLHAAYKSLKYLRGNWQESRPETKKGQKYYDSFPKLTHVGFAITTASGTPIVISIVWLPLALSFNIIGWHFLPIGLFFGGAIFWMGYSTWQNNQ